MGPDVALPTYEAFAAATAAEDASAPGGVLSYMSALEPFVACRANPTAPPDLSAFAALREAYLAIFEEVMDRHRLDALVFPQMRDELPPLHGPGTLHETSVCEINIAGLPGITVPAGTYASGSPFGLIFIGRLWSERDLISLANAYETATQHRRPPSL